MLVVPPQGADQPTFISSISPLQTTEKPFHLMAQPNFCFPLPINESFQTDRVKLVPFDVSFNDLQHELY